MNTNSGWLTKFILNFNGFDLNKKYLIINTFLLICIVSQPMVKQNKKFREFIAL